MRMSTGAASAITAGGTSQKVFDANKARKHLCIQNTSDTSMWVNFGGPATAASPSILVAAGKALWYDAPDAPEEEVHVIGATSSKAFSAWQGE